MINSGMDEHFMCRGPMVQGPQPPDKGWCFSGAHRTLRHRQSVGM